MKKNIFTIILFVAGALLWSNGGFSQEAKEKSPPAAPATEEGKTAPSSTDTESHYTLGDAGFVEEGAKQAPIASVATVPGGASGAMVEDADLIKEKGKMTAAKTPAAAADVNQTTAVSTSKGSKPPLAGASSAEMEKNWEALFSKEITPDSIAYTVKSGDSLYVLAKRFHTTVDFIKKINGRDNDALYPNMELKIHTAPFSIVVSKASNTLVLYADNKPVKQYPVATGKKNCTPSGTFKITNKLVDPTWFKTGAILPPGSPENALGSRWMGFDKPEYGIHGTIDSKSIGTQASQGCIRMLNADVEELYSMVPTGTQVTIQD